MPSLSFGLPPGSVVETAANGRFRKGTYSRPHGSGVSVTLDTYPVVPSSSRVTGARGSA